MSSSTKATPELDRQDVWDRRLLTLAEMVASWSKDDSTKVGAVVVTPENVIVSVGYNGFAQRMPDVEAHYADRQSKYSRIVHSETNAILLARTDVRGCTLYSTFPPCDRCAVSIIQAGIVRVVCPSLSKLAPDKAERWQKSMETARDYFQESGVAFIEVEESRRAPKIPPASERKANPNRRPKRGSA